eukprot:symbB.v1.2.017547.t1/scaffold1371.1/size209032/19
MQALLLGAIAASCHRKQDEAMTSTWTQQTMGQRSARSTRVRASKILKREGTLKIVTDEKNNWQLASAGTLMVGAAMVMVRGKRSLCQVGSVVSLNAGLDATRGNLRQAAWLLDTAARQRQAVDAQTYSNVIRTFAKRSEMREVLAWLTEARASNLTLDSDVYAAVTPNAVRRDVAPRDAIGHAGPRDWWSHVRRMRHEGFWEGQMTWQRVLHWLQYAFQSNPLPEIHAFEDAIRSLQKADKPELAAKWLRKVTDMRLHAQASTFRGVIMQCCASGLQTADVLVETMVSIGLTPSFDIYRALCTSKAILNKEAEVERWLSMLEDREKDLAPFSLMSCNYAAEGKSNAEVWLQRACESKLEPDLQCYNKVLAAHVQSPKAMGKCGKPMETCRRVVTRAAQHSGTYQRRELKLPAGAFNRCWRRSCNPIPSPTGSVNAAGDERGSISWMEEMLGKKLSPDLLSYNSLLRHPGKFLYHSLISCAMQGWQGQMPGCLPGAQAMSNLPQAFQDSSFGVNSWPGSFSEGSSCGSGCGGSHPSGMGASGGYGMSWSGGCGNMNPMQFAQLQMAQMQVQAMEAFNRSEEYEQNTPAPPERLIRDYNESQGFGFIECEDAKMRFGMDVFIHRRQMFGLKKDDEVSFVITCHQEGGDRSDTRKEEGQRKKRGCKARGKKAGFRKGVHT